MGVDLRSELPPVRDQGQSPFCVAFALTAVHENGASVERLSEASLFDTCKKVDGLPVDSGTTIDAATWALEAWGQCRAEDWPLDSTPPAALRFAAGLDFPDGSRRCLLKPHATSTSSLIAALDARKPIGVVVQLTREFYRAQKGRVALTAGDEAIPARHALVLVGYDLTGSTSGGAFIFRNSWGSAWGEHGYGRATFEYLERWVAPRGVVFDCTL
ncbi:MAG: C1 family peptidase [Actinomycetia bacterium]|nr:C1 family peptidase [Actinomycetes bacterium]